MYGCFLLHLTMRFDISLTPRRALNSLGVTCGTRLSSQEYKAIAQDSLGRVKQAASDRRAEATNEVGSQRQLLNNSTRVVHSAQVTVRTSVRSQQRAPWQTGARNKRVSPLRLAGGGALQISRLIRLKDGVNPARAGATPSGNPGSEHHKRRVKPP